MKYVIGIILLLCTQTLAAQELIFDNTGKLTNAYAFSSIKSSYSLSRSSQNHLSKEAKIAIRKKLIADLQLALNNMQDDSLLLKRLYAEIWGNVKFTEIIDELTGLRSSLMGNEIFRKNWNYVPSPSIIEAMLSTDVFSLSATKLSKDINSAVLIFTDPYKSWLIQYFNSSVSKYEMQKLNLDINYKTAWRELEQSYLQVNKMITSIGDYNKIFEFSAERSVKMNDTSTLIEAMIRQNYVVKLLKSNDFFKSWLWYTAGVLRINPLGITTQDRQFPNDERNSFDTAGAKLSQSQRMDSLSRLCTTKRWRNKITLPLFDENEDKGKLVYLWNYDGAKNYNALANKNKKTLMLGKEAIATCVYNIPENTSLVIEIDTLVLKDRSKTVIALDKLGTEATSTLVTGAESLLKHWVGISGLINPAPGAIPEIDIRNLNTKIKKGEGSGNSLLALKNSGDSNFQMQLAMATMGGEILNAELDNYIIINDRNIVITKDNNIDKKNIILAYLRKPDDDKCISCGLFESRELLLPSFLEKDKCYILNYRDAPAVEKSAENLMPRFNCYIKEVNEARKEAKLAFDQLTKLSQRLKMYIGITERSLAPLDLTEKTDESPEYRTHAEKIGMPESAKIWTIKVTPKIKNAAGVDSALSIVRTKFKVAPIHYVDFSIGISLLARNYTLREQVSDSALPVARESDRFRLMAGLHYYPFGLFNIDDKFIGGKRALHRVSVFMGVGIKKALDNFYTGLGYDLVPGMRLIIGSHFYKDTRFQIVNNKVVDKASGYKASGVFVSFNLEPISFTKLLGIF